MRIFTLHHQIVELLVNDKNSSWSGASAWALADHLADQRGFNGDTYRKEGFLDIDIDEINREYSQHESLQDWAKSYFGDDWKIELGINPDYNESMIDVSISIYIREHGFLLRTVSPDNWNAKIVRITKHRSRPNPLTTQKVVYIGGEGLASDKVFTKGAEYIITEGTVYYHESLCKVDGFPGEWNTVLFDNVDINKLPFKSFRS